MTAGSRDFLRKLFETLVARCMKEGVVGGEAFAVDASVIVADAHRRRSVAKAEDLDPTSSRAVAEYLSVLNEATPISPTYSAALRPAVYARDRLPVLNRLRAANSLCQSGQ